MLSPAEDSLIHLFAMGNSNHEHHHFGNVYLVDDAIGSNTGSICVGRAFETSRADRNRSRSERIDQFLNARAHGFRQRANLFRRFAVDKNPIGRHRRRPIRPTVRPDEIR